MSRPDPTAGFFGKVTTHGDFVGRRLPDKFVGAWDRWLQEGLHRSRTQLAERWLDTYLTSPIWRFALAPHVCDENAWAGVLMPSVDRVGRHFPLTIAAGVAGTASLLAWLEGAGQWYDAAERLALSTLHDGFALEEFDAALEGLPPLPQYVAEASRHSQDEVHGMFLPLVGLDRIEGSMPAIHRHIASVALEGGSVWWTDGSDKVAPSLLVCKGLPVQGPFDGMFDGQWQAERR